MLKINGYWGNCFCGRYIQYLPTPFVGVSPPETLGTDVAFKESEASPETRTEAVPAGCQTGNC